MTLLWKLFIFAALIAVSKSSTTVDPPTTTDDSGGEPNTGTTDDGPTDPSTNEITEICGEGYCYSLNTDAKEDTWANIDCDLAVLDSKEKILLVHGNLSKLFEPAAARKDVWIGANREGNVTSWTTGDTIADDADEWGTKPSPGSPEEGCVLLLSTDIWTLVNCTYDNIGLCQKADSDGGLSDGAIAGIAVGTTAVVGGAAGGGYYAYSKSKSSGVAPAAGTEGTDVEKQEEEDEDEEGEDQAAKEEETQE